MLIHSFFPFQGELKNNFFRFPGKIILFPIQKVYLRMFIIIRFISFKVIKKIYSPPKYAHISLEIEFSQKNSFTSKHGRKEYKNFLRGES